VDKGLRQQPQNDHRQGREALQAAWHGRLD